MQDQGDKKALYTHVQSHLNSCWLCYQCPNLITAVFTSLHQDKGRAMCYCWTQIASWLWSKISFSWGNLCRACQPSRCRYLPEYFWVMWYMTTCSPNNQTWGKEKKRKLWWESLFYPQMLYPFTGGRAGLSPSCIMCHLLYINRITSVPAAFLRLRLK